MTPEIDIDIYSDGDLEIDLFPTQDDSWMDDVSISSPKTPESNFIEKTDTKEEKTDKNKNYKKSSKNQTSDKTDERKTKSQLTQERRETNRRTEKNEQRKNFVKSNDRLRLDTGRRNSVPSTKSDKKSTPRRSQGNEKNSRNTDERERLSVTNDRNNRRKNQNKKRNSLVKRSEAKSSSPPRNFEMIENFGELRKSCKNKNKKRKSPNGREVIIQDQIHSNKNRENQTEILSTENSRPRSNQRAGSESSSHSSLDARLELIEQENLNPPKRQKLDNIEEKKLSYKLLFQLYTILQKHDENGMPGKLLRAATDDDWINDNNLIKYQRQVKEGKSMVGTIKAQLKNLQKYVL